MMELVGIFFLFCTVTAGGFLVCWFLIGVHRAMVWCWIVGRWLALLALLRTGDVTPVDGCELHEVESNDPNLHMRRCSRCHRWSITSKEG